MPDWRPDGHGESLWVEGERVAYVQHDAGGAWAKARGEFSAFVGPDAMSVAKLWAEVWPTVAPEPEPEPKPKRKRST